MRPGALERGADRSPASRARRSGLTRAEGCPPCSGGAQEVTMTELTRRGAVIAATVAIAAAAGEARAQGAGAAASYEVRPLPFDPTAVPGLSERLLVSHHDRNYAGA